MSDHPPLDALWAEFEAKLKAFKDNEREFGHAILEGPPAPAETLPMRPGESIDDYAARVRRSSFKLIKGDK
jgi:hypothetical protein